MNHLVGTFTSITLFKFTIIRYLQALDCHLSLTILRVEKGLDYSKILGDENEVQSIFSLGPSAMNQPSNASNMSPVHESYESLNRNPSQGT